MGFVPGYENDVFISYAHNDNEPFPGKPGWVDYFENILLTLIKGKVRGEIKVFRDQQLRLYSQFSDQLAHQLSNSAVFISILSPTYVESDWCLWELEQFSKRTGNNQIFKVVKADFGHQTLNPKAKLLLEQIKHVLDSRFYQRDESTGREKELRPEALPDHFPAYFEKMEAIAHNLVELLKGLRNAPLNTISSPAGSATTPVTQVLEQDQVAVYLAETTKDLADARNSIRTELLQFNYRVLPDQPLPSDADQLQEAIRGHLQKARLSVHLAGASYGTILDGEDRSIPHVQYDLAAEMSRQGQIKQIVWLPPGLAANGKQQEFLTNLKNDSPEYLQTKLEDLKTVIQKKLQPDAPNIWEDDEADPVNVCLFCDEQDIDSVKPLYNHLKLKELFKVKLPLKDAESLQHHKQLLQSSDAVLLYYGNADEEWFDHIWQLIEKYTSVGRTKPILAKAIYTGQPPTSEKDLLDSDDPLVLTRLYPILIFESATAGRVNFGRKLHQENSSLCLHCLPNC